MKKSFILYLDTLEIADKLDDETLGKFFRAIISYQRNEDIVLPKELELVFELFKNQFKRDAKKYETKCEQNRENANKRWQDTDANGCDRIQTDTTDATYADNDNDNDNGTGTGTDSGTDNEERPGAEDSFFLSLIPAKLNNNEFINAWCEWCSHYNILGKKMTSYSAGVMLKKLCLWESPIKVLEKSIEKGWHNLYELDELDKEDKPLIIG
jgi:hypothetical protein